MIVQERTRAYSSSLSTTPSKGHCDLEPTVRDFACGTFSTPSLAELRAQVKYIRAWAGSSNRVIVSHRVVQDILKEHALHPGALFQAASQLNCLEMPSCHVTPEAGVTGYQFDRTQGPACALACAGTIVRNYFVDVEALSSSDWITRQHWQHAGIKHKQLGQRADLQINTLDEVEEAVLASLGRSYWVVRNGYLQPDKAHLYELANHVVPHQEAARDALMSKVKIGLHTDVAVTFAHGAPHFEPPPNPILVTQAYCAAVPIESGYAAPLAPLARLLLDGLYEATLLAAVLNAARTGCPDVFLTFVGGGVWGNDSAWIAAAIARAVARISAENVGTLRVNICHFRTLDYKMVELINRGIVEYHPTTIDAQYEAEEAVMDTESERQLSERASESGLWTPSRGLRLWRCWVALLVGAAVICIALYDLRKPSIGRGYQYGSICRHKYADTHRFAIHVTGVVFFSSTSEANEIAMFALGYCSPSAFDSSWSTSNSSRLPLSILA